MKKKIPSFKTDQEAEEFVANADLSEYDLSDAKPVEFEFENKITRVNIDLPQSLLEAIKTRAEARGISYQHYVRETLEKEIDGF